ncbi:MAG: CocE/NonD family hydrolase [Proteobacteria bacterium]|nr:CocE/NonD family hydrolase [Pseudomonadota bacterium]
MKNKINRWHTAVLVPGMIVFAVFLFNGFATTSPVTAEQLPETLEDDIVQAVDEMQVENYAVDLNIRIPMTSNENPVGYDTDLWATAIYHTDIDEETQSTKRPTILLATAYRREIMGTMRSLFAFFPNGYNIVAVDMRGTGSGPGVWDPLNPVEQYDVAYLVDHWIPSQPWSDGVVGMTGGSYEAILQFLAAGLVELEYSPEKEDMVPKHLKAIAPISALSDCYKDIAMHGGNFDIEFLSIWIMITDLTSIIPPDLFLDYTTKFVMNDENTEEAMQLWEDHYNQTLWPLNWFVVPENEFKSDWYELKSPMVMWPQKPEGGWNYDQMPPDYGKGVIPKNLPVFTATGWFDIFERGSFNNYEYGLANHSASDKAMIVGPWYHIDAAFLMEGVDGLGLVGSDGGIFTWDILVRWFDWKIKGKDDPFMEEYPVALYVLGEDKWRAEKSWPLPESRTEDKTYFLSKDRPSLILGDWFSVSNRSNNYKLVSETSTSDYYNKFFWFKYPKADPELEHDPNDLHGGPSRSSQRWCGFSPSTTISQLLKYDLKLIDDRRRSWEDEREDETGVLTFTTEPLKEDMEIVGSLKLSFWASTEFTDPLTQKKIDEFLDIIRDQYNLEGNETAIMSFLDRWDVQWVVEVNDVFPGGRARNITSGWLSAAHRPYDPADPTSVDPNYVAFDPFYDYPDKHPDPIDENTAYKYVIEIWPTNNVFKKGHRIRLSLSASDFPHFLPVLRPSNNTIILDDSHKARLDFQVANKNGEGVTWKWIDDISDYLLNGK